MRVICLVPSWTETLIEAGVNVVGRTRFCIHPSEKAETIPVVGGTKDVDWEKASFLNPDLVLFDREENTEEMAESCPYPWHATHVTSINDMAGELRSLANIFNNPKLDDFAGRWSTLSSSRPLERQLEKPPALVKWVTTPPKHIDQVVYLIWANPWMAASAPTFIGSLLKWCGWEIWGDDPQDKYPVLDLSQFGKNTLFLCSTEPFPFAKRPDVMAKLPASVALVDGEKISWFGLRSLVYLESLMGV
jgi:hypothetical protein